MLARCHRVRKDEISLILKKGHNYHSPRLNLKIISAIGPTVFGVVVSTKVAKTAVARNKLKRRIRYILVKYINLINLNYKGIIFAKPEAKDALFNDLEKDIVYLLQSAKLINF
jgi:ribonuclease P protein component